MTAHDLYHGWFYHNGALRLSSAMGWGMQLLREDLRRLGLHDASASLEAAWLTVRNEPLHAPYRQRPALLHEGMPAYVLNWFDHDRPGRYWAEMDISQSLLQIAVPALHTSGWFDTYLSGSVEGFLALTAGAGSQLARDNQYLIAGPWVHIPWGDIIGDQSLGEEALLDTDALLLRWFNHWLRGSGEFKSEPKIRHFALGTNSWHSSATWKTEKCLELYLRSSDRANSRKGTGHLSVVAPSAEEARDVFVYDPEVPVFGPGGPISLSGPTNQAVIEMGNNLLVYTSAALTEALHVFGHPEIEIYCSTSVANADLTAKVVRVTLQGRSEFVCIGIARSSFLFHGSTYTADTTHRWQFSLEPTSCIFMPGESIRLEIAGSAFPLYDRNPCVGGVKPGLAEPSNWGRSTHMVLHELGFASLLRLPIFKGDA